MASVKTLSVLLCFCLYFQSLLVVISILFALLHTLSLLTFLSNKNGLFICHQAGNIQGQRNYVFRLSVHPTILVNMTSQHALRHFCKKVDSVSTVCQECNSGFFSNLAYELTLQLQGELWSREVCCNITYCVLSVT